MGSNNLQMLLFTKTIENGMLELIVRHMVSLTITIAAL